MTAAKMTIGDVARLAGVGVETVRFYERKALIRQPPKPKEGYRVYSMLTVAEIAFIRQAQELGFSLREIGELLELQANAAADCGDVRQQCENKLRDVRGKIGQLRRMEKALETLIAACPGRGAIGDCTIMDALAEPASIGSEAKGHAMKRIEWKIDGMHCDNCATRLTGLLSRSAGVNQANVSLKRGIAEIVYDPNSASPETLRTLIEDAGFSVRAS